MKYKRGLDKLQEFRGNKRALIWEMEESQKCKEACRTEEQCMLGDTGAEGPRRAETI